MLVIEDDILLNALLVALVTVKFEARPEDTGEVASSPLVAEVCNRTYEALMAAERAKACFGTAQRLEDSRSAEDKPLVRQAIQSHIQHHKSYWASCDLGQKHEFVRILLSPYTASEEFIDDIVQNAANQ